MIGARLLPFILLAAAPGVAQDDLAVLKPETSPRRMLSAYLEAQAKPLFDARRKSVAALRTPDDVRRRQEALRARFIEAIGGFPERTPLQARVVGKEARDGYRVERVVYESRPNHHVTATLYLPEGGPPFPGVLMPMGHSSNGKAADYAQRGSILMARNGLAVLCYDPIGQGERRQLLDAQGKPAVGSSTTEHTLVGVGALLVGWCAATYRIWDGIRSLDYLASRPEIDPKRLGCTGVSGGGTLTSYLMALDDRIAAAAPSCYLTTLERLFSTIGPQDAEQNIPGQVALGLEQTDYVFLRAPRPTLILAATRDFFDIRGTWTTYLESKLVYGIFGQGDRVDFLEIDAGHGYPKPHREAATRFMRRWLLGRDEGVEEGAFPIAKDAELSCTTSGQALADLKGRSAFAFTADRAAELAVERAKSKGDRLADVRRLIGLPDGVKPAKRRDAGAVRRGGAEIRKLVFETEPGIQVPGLLFSPRDADRSRPLVLYVNGQGMAAGAAPEGPIEKLVRAGSRVLAVDPRGVGETAPAVLRDPPGAFGMDFKESFLAQHLARPLLGQRVFDLLAVIGAAEAEAPAGFHLVGVGAAAPVALHAAALDGRVKELTLEGSILSWTAVARTPLSQNQLSNAVPGALRVYDLPELAGSFAPRPITVRAPLDAAGGPATLQSLQAEWEPCRARYREKGAADRLILEAGPGDTLRPEGAHSEPRQREGRRRPALSKAAESTR